jgi:hypothetical protein
VRFQSVPDFPFTNSSLNGLIAYLTVTKGGNPHENGVVEITASSVFKDDWGEYFPRNAVDVDSQYSEFSSKDEKGQWIILDLKGIKIRLTHYPVRAGSGGKPKS